MFGFKILAQDKKSRARAGLIETPHGSVETPAYTIVGTNAAVRTLHPEDLPATQTQLIIANTYHLWRELGDSSPHHNASVWCGDKLDSFEGLHERMGFRGAIMTDSGGFQVFSLGFAREHGTNKVAGIMTGRDGINLTKITDDGVFFHDDGREIFLNPEISIGIQAKLGADIIFAFDECTSPLNDHEYNRQAMERTHAWAKRCLAAKTRTDQALYGIVQGGRYRDLREESAKFIGALPFAGFGIGGSFGKEEMREVLDWTIPLLPEEKPRHLLGIGRIEDVLDAVEMGVDTLDCVIPTREARHGSIWTAEGRYDVKKGRYAGDRKPLAKNCACPICVSGRTRGEIKALFAAHNHEAGRLATIHNVFFFNNFMRQVREAIKEGMFAKFKKNTLRKLS